MKSFKKDSSPPRKRPYTSISEEPKHEWKVGEEFEHLWTEPFYIDVFHPARIVSIDKKKGTATVQYLAFSNEPVQGEELSYFYPYRPPQPNYPYQLGDRVHFKMYGRKVRGRNVDGDVGIRGEGVWVKGVITEIPSPQKDGQFCVCHYDWSAKKPGSYTTCWVERRDLRLDEYTSF